MLNVHPTGLARSEDIEDVGALFVRGLDSRENIRKDLSMFAI